MMPVVALAQGQVLRAAKHILLFVKNKATPKIEIARFWVKILRFVF
jgi:hypothetical protein